ncbi:MAG: 30S ribosomal protein S17, partial [Desulfobacteraceae bacterium]
MTQRGGRKKRVGVVVSNRMDKTAAVLVNRLKKHRTYKKYIRSQTRYMV